MTPYICLPAHQVKDAGSYLAYTPQWRRGVLCAPAPLGNPKAAPADEDVPPPPVGLLPWLLGFVPC